MTLVKLAGFAVGPVMAAAIGLLTVPLMAWLFSPQVVGQIAMFNTFLAGCALVLTLGLDQAYVREYHEADSKPGLLRALGAPPAIAVVLVCALIVLCHREVALLLFDEPSHSLWIAGGVALTIAVTILYRFLSLVLRMQEQGLQFSLLQISSKLVLAAALLLLLALQTDAGFITAFGISCLAFAAAAGLALLLTRKECRKAMTAVVAPGQVRQALQFGMPLVASGFAFWGLISVDRWAIRYFAGLEQLGIYSVAFSFAAVMTIFQQVFSTVWAPIVYRWHQQGVDISQFNQITDWVVIVLSTVFVLVSMASPLLLWFLPDAYGPVVYLLPACMLYPVFYTLSETTVVGMNVARKTGYSVVVTLVPLALNLALCYWLIPRFGAGGAALAVAVAFYLYLLMRTEVSKRVWQHFETGKLYLVSLVLIVCAAWPALMQTRLPWYCNLALLLLVAVFYRQRFLKIRQELVAITK